VKVPKPTPKKYKESSPSLGKYFKMIFIISQVRPSHKASSAISETFSTFCSFSVKMSTKPIKTNSKSNQLQMTPAVIQALMKKVITQSSASIMNSRGSSISKMPTIMKNQIPKETICVGTLRKMTKILIMKTVKVKGQ
jgi:hypothetical protein